MCTRCARKEETLSCGVGSQTLEISCFPAGQLKNKNRNAEVRCTTCHVCMRCRRTLTARSFASTMKSCKVCAKERESEKRSRVSLINKTLKAKGAWRCTCKKLTHSEKCQLFPVVAGERRWPGKNKGVTREDLDFIAKRFRGERGQG